MSLRRPQDHSKLQRHLRKQHRKWLSRRGAQMARRGMQLESLEERMLLAVGPQLVSINPNTGELLRDNDVRNIAPRELVFRFDGNQIIDPATLDGIHVTGSGLDGSFGIADVITDFGTVGAVVARFTALTPGPSGNNITIQLIPTDFGGPNPPIITVDSGMILAEVNTAPGNETTALDLVTAINNNAASQLLVQGEIIGGLTGTDVATDAAFAPIIQLNGANVAQIVSDLGTNGGVQVRFAANSAGKSQNGIQVDLQHFDFGGPALPIIQTIGNRITVTLNTSPGSETLAEELITAINTHPFASQLITATQVVGDSLTDISTPTLGLGALVLSGAADEQIIPGFIGVNPNEPNHVTVRFAETLPDDIYSIDVLGTGSNALTNIDSERFNDGTDLRLRFELDLGARILAVVPQPVTRDSEGNLDQAGDQIVVYFNDDDLDPVTAADPNFYQLIFTNHRDEFEGDFDTATNTDDMVILPRIVEYDADSDTAVLTFADPDGMPIENLSELIGDTPGTFRLRVGTDERFDLDGDELHLPPPPRNIDPDLPNLVTDFNTGGAVEITLTGRADLATAVRLNVTSSDQGRSGSVQVSVVGNVISVELNSNNRSPSTAIELVGALNTRASHLLSAQITSGPVGTDIGSAITGFTTFVLIGQGSSFETATDLGELGVESQIVSSSITPQDYPLEFPGAIREPGHRDIPTQQHILAVPMRDTALAVGDSTPGITTRSYNFQEIIGADPEGNVLFNLISEAQKQRAREIFEIYGNYLGVQFVETPNSGLTIATGDLRALSPSITTGPGGVIGLAGGGTAIMDNAEQWDDTFGASDDPARSSWFNTAMHEIGHLLGLGHTDELSPLTIMNDEPALRLGNRPEDVFPGDNDLVHGLHLYRPESKDIDLYKFNVTETGQLTAETIAERQANSSFLDTVLNLYRENADGSRKLISRNDDYFSEDSFLRIDLEPGTYYVGVSASGNAQYDPTREDSGFDGKSQGDYDLRLFFRPTVDFAIVDSTGTTIDGDADGVPGGAFNYWFRVGTTHFVDKAATGPETGEIGSPFSQIDTAMSAASPGDIVRVIGNGGADGDVRTLDDNFPYEVGFDTFGAALDDGTIVNVPKGITLMIDAGAIFKMRRSAINVGSSAIEIDRSGGALQVLGTPEENVIFTSFNDESLGADTDPLPQNPRPGDWGGLIMRNDLDRSEGRFDYERQGIFLDFINQADIRYGGANVVIDSVEQTFTPIHLIDSRPTLSYNTITNSAKAAISANPDSFEETNFHAPLFQSVPFTSGYDRVGPNVHGNRLTDNSVNGLFVRIDTPAGNAIEQLTVAGRWDDTDITHIVLENMEVRGTPGGPSNTTGSRTARLDAGLVIDPGIIVKLGGAGIEVELGTQLIAEGLPGREIVFTSIMDDRFGAAGSFDASNNGATVSPTAGDWTGLYWGQVSRGSLDNSLIAYGGGITKIEGTFAGFNPIEIHQAEVRITNSLLENNADGTGGQARRNRFGQGRNESGAIYILGAQPILLNNVIRNTRGGTGVSASAININANALNSQLLFDYGRSTGLVDLETRYRDNQGPLIRDNQLGNNDINGLEVRGATLTTESVWDDTDIVHVLAETIHVPDFHTYGGLRLESSPTESLVVKLTGTDAGFTATGRPLDINDRIGGAIQIIGQPGRPVVLTSLSDGSVGAGEKPDGSPQFNTSNEILPGRTLPAGSFQIDLNFGPTISQNPTVMASIRRAADVWQGLMQDPLTVVIDVEFGATSSLASTFTERFNANYDEARGRMIADAGSHEAIVTELPTFSELQTTLPGGANSGVAVTPFLDLARANALALGYDPSLLPATVSSFDPNEIRDAAITLSTTLDVPGGDEFDVALHEIGHALGFTSTVDGIDNGAQIVALNPMDLFRLEPGDGSQDFRNSPRALDPALNHVFYDGGIFNPAGIPIPGLTTGDIPLSSGVTTGDGSQASHWKSTAQISGIDIGTMRPTVGGVLSDQDRRAFDLIGWDVVTVGTPGEWRSIRFDEYSHDRNVEVITEIEPPALADENGNTFTAELLGQLASTEKGGDENLRLGFEVHGYLSHTNDVDVYSFRAKAGTEVWLDIDRTTHTLDTVIELIDADGGVIAASDDSLVEAVSTRVTNPAPDQTPVGRARPMPKTTFHLGDLYSTNMADAGMRVVLPGGRGTTNTYHARIRSAADNAGASGVYQLQVRLRETDEVPGSTVRYADIRFATNGIEVLGLPAHSPLVGETAETTALNDTRMTAQFVGNALAQDQGALSISGFLDSTTDVDWYQFDVMFDSTQMGGDYGSIIFDLDYADGLARANASLWIFDDAGNLVLFNRDGQITDDKPAPASGDDLADLSRGSAGNLDPFIGPVSLPMGTYYAAVTTSAQMPDLLDDGAQRNTTVPTLRFEPVDSLTRVVEEHFGDEPNFFTGDESTTNEPTSTPVLISSAFAIYTPDGFDINDGETVSVTNLFGETVVYEFDINGLTVPGHEPVAYTAGDIDTVVATNLGNAMTLRPPTGVVPIAIGNVISFAGDIADIGVPTDSALFAARPAAAPFFLGDLTLYVSAATPTPNGPGSDRSSLYMVDPFQGLLETTVGGFGQSHGALAMRTDQNRADPRLFTFATSDAGGNIDDMTTSEYLEVDWVTGDVTVTGTTGLETFVEQLPNPPPDPPPDPPPPPVIAMANAGFIINAMTFVGPASQQLFGVGERGDLGLGDPANFLAPNDYGENILFEFDRDTGAAIDGNSGGPRPADPMEFTFNGGGFEVREYGYIDTSFDAGNGGTVMKVVEATTVQGANTTFEILDGLSFNLTDGVAISQNYTMDAGPQVRVDFMNANSVRDGQFFTLDGDRFEFDTGTVLNVTGDSNSFLEGEQFTITDGQGTLRTFEVDTAGDGVTLNVSQVTIAAGANAQQIAQTIATAINTAGFGVIATSAANRVLLTGETNVSLAISGVFTDGMPGVTAGSVAIPVEENFTPTQVGDAVVAALLADGNYLAGFEGDRLNFPNAQSGDFAGAPIFSDVGTQGENFPTSIDFLADDTVDQIAVRIANAINVAVNGNVASASGDLVTLSRGFQTNFAELPFTTGGTAPGGKITGMTEINGTFYAVSDTGGLWSFSGPSPAAFPGATGVVNTDLITTVVDDNGRPISFGGLTRGPTDVEGGRYAEMMFGVSSGGNLYAMNDIGQLQPIFMNGATSARTGVGAAVGLTFGTLENNLWHFTVPGDNTPEREGAAGHGLQQPVTETKDDSDGDTSIHFGAGEPGNYLHPGGSHGTIVSNTFSLKNYGPEDKPFLYFNYFVGTQDNDGGAMLDAIRVYVSDDSRETNRGQWHLVGTNNSTVNNGDMNDEQDDPDVFDDINLGVDSFNVGDFDLPISELFDNAGWRQARISLRDFVGSEALRFRFDFATAGDIGLGSFEYGGLAAGGNEGEELRAVDADRIRNGQRLTIDGSNFRFNFGFILSAPTGDLLADGETFTVDDGSGNPIAFEFDNNGQTTGNNIPILFSEIQSAVSVAGAMQAAILGSGLAVAPHVSSNLVNLVGATTVIQSAGAGAASPAVYVDGGQPLLPGDIPIQLNLSMDANQVKYQLIEVLANEFAGGNRDAIKHYRDVIKVIGHTVIDPGPLSVTQFLAPESYRGFQYGVDAGTDGQGPARRAQDNDFEGIYIDDIIVGFAGRGEMVTGDDTSVVDFVADPTNPDFQIEEGAYQLEIRRAPEYGIPSTDPPQFIFRGFDPNDRLTESLSIHVADGAHVSAQQAFEIGNGLDAVAYKFVDRTVPEGDDSIATATPTGLLPGVPGSYMGIGSIGDNVAFGDNNNAPNFGLDVDLFRVDIAEGDDITIDVNALTSPNGVTSTLPAVLRVFDALGNEESNDNVPFFGTDPFLQLVGLRDGTIYVGVSRDPNATYDPNVPLSGLEIPAPRTPRGGTYEIRIDINGGRPDEDDGTIPIPFATFEDEATIAQRVMAAINSPASQSKGIGVTASLTGGGQVDLFGDIVVVNDPSAFGKVPSGTRITPISVVGTEPNDVPANATPTGIVAGESTTVYAIGEIGDNVENGSPEADVDLYEVNLAAGDVLRVEARLDEIGSNLAASVFVQDALGIQIAAGTGQLDPPATALVVPATETDPELVFVAPSSGTFFVGIASLFGAFTGDYELVINANGATDVEQFNFFGDNNVARAQGQLIIHSNIIRDALEFGIVVDAGQRDAANNPHIGPPRVTREVNEDRFVPGVTINNNIVAGGGDGAIRYSGDTNPANQPTAAVPFGRIVNNTLYGDGTADTGILVENSASPTLLNNIVANFSTGVSVDNSSGTTVLGGMLFQGNASNGSAPNGLGDFLIVLNRSDPLFVDAVNGNYYLDLGSAAIDSSVNSLEDRPELVTIRDPLGIPVSPILAPGRDVTGQLRVDDPDVDSPAGIGEDVFKDRGALERADFVGLSAVLLSPADNDADGFDINPAKHVVQTFDVLEEFSIRLVEGAESSDPSDGTGADDLTVTTNRVTVTSNGALLEEGVDYEFEYDPTNNIINLRPSAGIWPGDQTYVITLDNSPITGIRDLANNPLRPNQPGGETQFTMILGGNIDFGDAPDPTYPTLLENDGARHEFRVNFFLGLGVDSEQDGQPSSGAAIDLDDGVTFPNEIRAGYDTPITVVASMGGLLDAWLDLNIDGDWDDAGEQIFTNEPLVAGGNNLFIPLSLDTTLGDTYARFRFSSTGNLGPSGLAADGEVEDYRITILDTGTDFGDAPDPTYPTLLASDGARHEIMPGFFLGDDIDPETDGQASSSSDGDGSDDDGVRFDTQLVAGGTASITVTASAAGLLDAWIDLNGDGDWDDNGEQIFTSEPLVAGENTLSFNVDGTTTGPSVARFRLSTAGGLAPTGLASDGEVEDYRVVIAQPILDFGDAPVGYPTLLAEDGARHVLTTGFFLGSTIDPEEDGQPSAAATGDGADEDGITFPAEIFTGEEATLTVTASAAGMVDAWIDFNRDGDWDDDGERILASESVVAGINMVNVTIDPVALPGLAYARFRFSSAGGLTPSGQAPDGEVEDYEVAILASSWHNVASPTDVNGVNGTTPLDALLVINELTVRMFSDPVTGVLELPANPPPFFDVDDNGVVSPLDALMVISDIPTTPPQAPLAALAAPPLAASILDTASVNRAETRDDNRAVETAERQAAVEPFPVRDQLHDVALRSVKRFVSRSDRAEAKLSEAAPDDKAEDTLDDVFSGWE